MFSPLPCLATFRRSSTPRNPDSRASAGVMSGNPIGSIESTSISPSSMRYRRPALTRGLIQMRTELVISPRRTPSRSRLANTMLRIYFKARWPSDPNFPITPFFGHGRITSDKPTCQYQPATRLSPLRIWKPGSPATTASRHAAAIVSAGLIRSFFGRIGARIRRNRSAICSIRRGSSR